MAGSEFEDRMKDIEERSRKNHEMIFEACKHFTTLDTAAALIVVALFRETSTGILGALWPLVCFGLSLVVCAYGMIATAMGGLENERAAISAGSTLISGASIFFLGLVWAVYAALPS
ncbi:MAG: hypothetical protein M3R38_11230 [Actinomycetota bacterium]|nr:hypothetical protein [Actinomycetota bacterium]